MGLPLRSVTAKSRSLSSTSPSPLRSKSGKSSIISMRPCLENSQIKIRVDALNLAAKVQGVIAADHRDSVGKLQAALFGALRHAERRAVLNAGKGKLRSGSDGLDVVEEGAETEVETVHVARIQYARVVREERMCVVSARLPLRS